MAISDWRGEQKVTICPKEAEKQCDNFSLNLLLLTSKQLHHTRDEESWAKSLGGFIHNHWLLKIPTVSSLR